MVSGKTFNEGSDLVPKKKKIQKEIAKFLKAFGHVDRNSDKYKTRIHTLFSACKNYIDAESKITGTAPPKIPPCFDVIDEIRWDKPKTFSPYLSSSNGSYTTVLEDNDSDVLDRDLDDVEIGNSEITESILNFSNIDIKYCYIENKKVSSNVSDVFNEDNSPNYLLKQDKCMKNSLF